jgi:APA family basic amino acid/polyamine antiporter
MGFVRIVGEVQMAEQHKDSEQDFVKGLGLTSATTLVMGSMIGSGIFIVSADIARETASPALLIAAWLVTGFMTITAALSYGELAAMMPKAGGQYVYLRESLGGLWGFLYGWTLFLVIQTGTIAAVGVAFGKFLGVLVPSVSSSNWIIGPLTLGSTHVGLNTQNLVGIVLIVVLTAVNVLGVKTGAMVQNVFTFTKVVALLGLVLLGFFVAGNHEAIVANFSNFWLNAGSGATFPSIGLEGLLGVFVIVAVAQVGSLFSSDAWNNVTFTAGEVINPKRNLPLSLVLGTGTVIALYVATNFVYLCVLPLAGIQNAPEDRVATAVMQVAFGDMGAAIMAIGIMISTAGCNNGLILAGARVYYAMAKDGLFFKRAGTLHPAYRTPTWSLWMQCAWTCVLCLSGTYGQLLDYIIFAVLIFYVLTIVGLFVLRRTQPDAPRPYKAFGYPILPAIYIVMACLIDFALLIYKPQYTWPGLIIVLTGIPVYFWWSRQPKAKRAE